MARRTQINVDGSRLEGVDLSKVPNQKIAFKKTERTRLNALSANATKASISAAANVSTVGQGLGSIGCLVEWRMSNATGFDAPLPPRCRLRFPPDSRSELPK
jgi:hypothetical protein